MLNAKGVNRNNVEGGIERGVKFGGIRGGGRGGIMMLELKSKK